MNARILPGMSLSVSWCDGQLLKLPFSVPAENVEDPGCGVHADGWRGAWCCPCCSSPRGEIRLGSRAQRGVSLVSSCRLASPHVARFLSSSLIWLLHQPNTRCESACAFWLWVPLQPPWDLLPAKDVQVPAHMKTTFLVEGEQPKERKREKKKFYQTERGKEKGRNLRNGEGYSFKEGCNEEVTLRENLRS